MGGPVCVGVRRRPTLPQGSPCSTIGAEGLNFRVRNGTGCFPFAVTAVTLWRYQGRPRHTLPRLWGGWWVTVSREPHSGRDSLLAGMLWMLIWVVTSPRPISTSRLHESLVLDPAVRAALAARCAEVATPAGASAVAEALLALADTFGGHRPSSRERIRTVNLALRANAMRALGPAGTSAVRRARGRATGSGPVRPLAVRPLVTHDLDAEVLRGDHPVEHLLRDSSPAYRTRRLAIAQEFYDWSATH